MGLFGKSNEETAQDVEIQITASNSWLGGKPIPKAIIRNLPIRGNDYSLEYFKDFGCDYVYPCILTKDCVKITETDQTFEIKQN